MRQHATPFVVTAEGIKALKPDTKCVDYWDATLSDGQLVDIAVGGRDERLHVWLLLGHPDEVGQRLGVHLFA